MTNYRCDASTSDGTVAWDGRQEAYLGSVARGTPVNFERPEIYRVRF